MCNPIVSGLSGCLHVIFTKFNDVKKNVSFSDLCLDGESLVSDANSFVVLCVSVSWNIKFLWPHVIVYMKSLRNNCIKFSFKSPNSIW